MWIFNIRNLQKIFNFLTPIIYFLSLIGVIFVIYLIKKAPVDIDQGKYTYFMYFHVPFAWLSLIFYALMTLNSALYLSWKYAVSAIFLKIFSQIGTFFCILCLVTGSIWGKLTWGIWWAWDARMTAMFVLFLFYLIHFIVRNNVEKESSQNMILSILTIIGFINIPIIKYSVEILNSVHQTASVKIGSKNMPNSMLFPLLLNFLNFSLFSAAFAMQKFKKEIKKKKFKRKISL